MLEELKTETRTIIIYEAPHHLVRTLQELSDTLGGDRRLTICRELTKRHEEKCRPRLRTVWHIMKSMNRAGNMSSSLPAVPAKR